MTTRGTGSLRKIESVGSKNRTAVNGLVVLPPVLATNALTQMKSTANISAMALDLEIPQSTVDGNESAKNSVPKRVPASVLHARFEYVGR